jgi:methylmalonyl-CoA mutase C-terminal domain/subunit
MRQRQLRLFPSNQPDPSQETPAVRASDASNNRGIKVLIAKPGLDGHDRGAKVLIHALRDAGMEILYTGLHNTIEEIVQISLEEDVDVIGLSIYSGAHLPLSQKLMAQLENKKLTDKLILVGGNIPSRDIDTLKGYGIHGVFPTGSNLDEIAAFIRENVNRT